jgi:hypothetical protein
MTSPHHTDPPHPDRFGVSHHDETADEVDVDLDSVDEAADTELLALLGEVLHAADPVPESVLAAARGAVAWRTIDQDLADLVFDSSAELTGVRDLNAARQLTFRSDDVEIELMVVDSTQRRLVGQIVPAMATTVRLEGTETQVEQIADRFGRFSFDGVQTGPVRITVPGALGGRAITTDWMLL